MIDLNPSYLAVVERILAEHVPECEVRAFGSRASWTAKDYSDLDLAIAGDGPLDWRTLALLKEAFEESDLPMRVDVLDWHDIAESFQHVIERNYVVLQAGSEQLPPDEWRSTTLGDVLTLQRGFDLPQTDRQPGDFPVIASTGQVGTHNQAMVQGPGVVVGRSGSLGGGQYIRDDFWPLNTTLWVKNFKGNDPRFCYFLLKSLDLGEFNAGSGVPTLNRNHIHPLPVQVPRLPEQRAISHVLGTLDDKIELNRHMNETLEEMARALFRSWFVDFEPVRAKMEGRWRSGESLPGLPADLYDLFPDRLVPSELGEVPEGWEVKALGDVVELNPSEPMRRGTIAPYLDMGALPTVGSSPNNAILREFTSGTRFRNGDTLLARITPCLENGKTAFIQSLPNDVVGWGSTEFIVMRARSPVPLEYSYLLARDAAFREHAIQSMTGTSGRQRVQVDALAPYPLLSPPTETWNRFSAFIRPLFAQLELNRTESLALSAQRDALLPRLVSGEVRVEEATAA